MEFPKTSWTILAAATMNGGREEAEALNQLCRDYWRPVKIIIQGRGAPAERVEDLTQEFFMQLMEKGFFKKADPQQGSFRSFMLGALRYFLADDAKRTMAEKRGGKLQRVELEDYSQSVAIDETQFDAAWAELLFDRVYGRVENEVRMKRGVVGWEALKQFLPGSDAPITYAELADALGMSEGGAKTEVFRLRERFRDGLRSEVGKTVGAPHEIDDELAYLRSALG